jgi:predicted RNA-binding protein YlqC (UPF0109 family)
VSDVNDASDVDDASDEHDDDFEDDVDDANRVMGALPKNVLTYLAKSIVEDPEAVVVETEERRNSVMLRLHVAPGDMGRVIGRRGRVAQAIRSVVRAAGAREGVDASVDIVD